MTKIVILDGYTINPGDNPWGPLASLGELEIYERSATEEIVARSRQAEVLVVNKIRMSREIFAELPQLRLVTVTATGHDCVDSLAAREAGVVVCNVPEYGTASVAQFTIALLLELAHHVGRHDQLVRDGEWQRAGDFSFWRTPQVELAGLRLGIMGWGRIGQRVGKIATALGMEVWGSSRSQRDGLAEPTFRWADRAELFAECDVVSLHCPLTEETRQLVNRRLLETMRPHALLINTARGGLICEADLASALHERVLAGAAVDVASVEPIDAGNPLLTAPRCLITPHMAWSTLAARRRLLQTTADNIRMFLSGHPQNVVLPPAK
jgi:glycerate dehydrogenase